MSRRWWRSRRDEPHLTNPAVGGSLGVPSSVFCPPSSILRLRAFVLRFVVGRFPCAGDPLFGEVQTGESAVAWNGVRYVFGSCGTFGDPVPTPRGVLRSPPAGGQAWANGMITEGRNTPWSRQTVASRQAAGVLRSGHAIGETRKTSGVRGQRPWGKTVGSTGKRRLRTVSPGRENLGFRPRSGRGGLYAGRTALGQISSRAFVTPGGTMV